MTCLDVSCPRDPRDSLLTEHSSSVLFYVLLERVGCNIICSFDCMSIHGILATIALLAYAPSHLSRNTRFPAMWYVQPAKAQNSYLEFLSLKGGCIGSSASTFVKMPHCRKSHVACADPETGVLSEWVQI